MTRIWYGVTATVMLAGGMIALAARTPADGASALQAVAQEATVEGRQGRGQVDRGTPRKRVLAWADTRNGQAQHASVGHALAIIERLGYDSGMWDTYIRTDSEIISTAPKKTDGTPASGGPNLGNVDAIFFMGHREVPLDPAQKEELLAFVREGHGFVAAHTALTAFDSWPEFGEMLGGGFDQHPVNGPGTVINESPEFPATRHFAPSFDFVDEFYQPKNLDRATTDVLLRLDLSNVAADPRLHLDGDYPLAWAKKYGEGRVFFSSFSHASETWDRRDVQQMYFEAIRWALGLTEADPQPHPMRGSVVPARSRGRR